MSRTRSPPLTSQRSRPTTRNTARYLAELQDEAGEELTEPEWDDADSNRYQDQIEAAERDAAPDQAWALARSIPYRLTAKAEALLDAETGPPDPEAQ